MKIIIATHYGFCMGVKRAISIAEKNADIDDKVTIFREIVHNDAIVDRFKKMGIGQSDTIDNIDHGTVIIPAHGADPGIFEDARSKKLNIVNATCPLVIRIHKIVKKLAQDGYFILHFGDNDHDETIGIVGYAPNRMQVINSQDDLKDLSVNNEELMALTSQTTARRADFERIVEMARKKYPQIKVYNTICDATSQRQDAITGLAPRVDLMLVVGSRSSANSNRLAGISASMGTRSYLINSADEIDAGWFKSPHEVNIVGLSAGASTPDFLIEGVISRLKEFSDDGVEVVYPPRQERSNRLALDGE